MNTWTEFMTQEMLDNLPFRTHLEKEISLCNKQIESTEIAANITLPATAANGKPARHGARMCMGAVVDYWRGRRALAMLLLKQELYVDN